MYCPYRVFIRVHQRFILFPISNTFKKLNQRQHDLTHILLKVMIFDLRCILQSFYQILIKRQSVNLCIQSKYRKIRTRKNYVFEHFSRSEFSLTQVVLLRILSEILFNKPSNFFFFKNCPFKKVSIIFLQKSYFELICFIPFFF